MSGLLKLELPCDRQVYGSSTEVTIGVGRQEVLLSVIRVERRLSAVILVITLTFNCFIPSNDSFLLSRPPFLIPTLIADFRHDPSLDTLIKVFICLITS